jgi:exosortase E/protease (VPEID-CTERM system)
VNLHAPQSPPAWQRRFGIGPRIIAIAIALTVETVLLSMLIQATITDLSGFAAAVHSVQHWLFRFLIAYAVSWCMLLCLREGMGVFARSTLQTDMPLRLRWLAVHGAILAPLAYFSAALYGDWLNLPFLPIAIAWHLLAIAAVISLFRVMAPLRVWLAMLRRSGALAAYAVVPALGAVLAIQGSQRLWVSAAKVTFLLVEQILQPLIPHLLADPDARVLGTSRFAVSIAEVCSGLEGVGLMLVFCCAWLWYFRREFRFPRVLLVIPVALLLVFLLNALRIAAIVLIGDAGYERIAMIGFHSQAGWIAFNLVAFAVALLAKRSAWLNRTASARPGTTGSSDLINPTSPYLLPLLTLLAVGMLVHAMSAGFDLLYPLRLICTGLVLWLYRHRYRGISWGFSWRGIAGGAAVFAIWFVVGQRLLPHQTMPEALAELSPPMRALWICCRLAAAVVTVPLAEELAYRGYLLRRIASPNFDALPFSQSRWPALLISSAIFGAMHGSMWLPGCIAGLAYGLLAIRTNRLGESVAAHATSNLLLGVAVLIFDQWQWW